ncbi:MAG: hypothetical protein U1A78_38025 [Polyangia bacterium]
MKTRYVVLLALGGLAAVGAVLPKAPPKPVEPRGSLSAVQREPEPRIAPQPAAVPAEKPESIGGKWIEDADVSVMDGLATGYAALDAEEPLPAVGGERKPTLMIRCTPKRKLELYVVANAPVRGEDGETEVQYRLDSNPPITQKWTESDDYTSIFAPRPLPMYDQIAKSERLLVKYQPFVGPPRVATFDVRGLRARSGQLSGCLKRR